MGKRTDYSKYPKPRHAGPGAGCISILVPGMLGSLLIMAALVR